MKGKIRTIIALMLIVGLVGGCTIPIQIRNNTENSFFTLQTEEESDIQEESNIQEESDIQEETMPYAGSRPILIKGAVENVLDSVPCVAPYTIEPDLSNVDNLWQYYLEDGVIDKLVQNGFVVCGSAGSEFFDLYEENRYALLPSFVTVDSMMHTYHLYFSYLLKNTERSYLADSITQLSKRMIQNSIEQYNQLQGSEWEEAARRNIAFFTVGASLLDPSTEVLDSVSDIVAHELDCINQARGIEESTITGAYEDYTQYIPRGYYAGDEALESYFKAMMWYGRIHFRQDDVELDRSALLMTKALEDDTQAYQEWEAVYAVTSFFAGASDDLGVCEYMPVLQKAYGSDAPVSSLAGNATAFDTFHTQTGKLAMPQINSIPIMDGEEVLNLGFRFMGQRFTIDAAIMQQLIYSNIEENSAGQRRYLPDVLDVPAALGSDVALDILDENGATEYAGYQEAMEKLRAGLSQDQETLWSASLYASWLHTLRPLLIPKGEGYPTFMQNEEWSKKNLECFAGSFTELKHDTILYTKQVIAEMGGGYDEEPDYRGYVEPEPLVYARFANLATQTAQGLKQYGMLRAQDEENLERLSQIAQQLLTISQKELQDQVLTQQEYEFIETYGGSIEHFWYESMKEEGDSEGVFSQECPAAVVVDVATNPNGEVLEMATGNPSIVYVIVKVDGKLKIARGSVYSFYQFAWPLEDRLTDAKWHQMIGIQPDDTGEFSKNPFIQKPSWTDSYRYQYEWE